MYLSWEQQTVTDFSDAHIEDMYAHGFVFTRMGRGEMSKTRSLRVDLSQFELSSENRRILKKVEGIEMKKVELPFPDYSWRIHKLGAHFYNTKFGNHIFSANKIKEIMTEPDKTSFNRVFVFTHNETGLGYAIALETESILHYSYPFYDLEFAPREMGMGMMTRALVWAKESIKKYVYLGSARRPADTYKLQFAGVEWFDGGSPEHGVGGWTNDITKLKSTLRGESANQA